MTLPDANHLDADHLDADTAAGSELEWWDRALCAQVDTELFFPEKGGSTREAKAVCSRCEVRPECAGYALHHNERYGIWGGLSELDRRRIRRRSEAAAADTACADTKAKPAAAATAAAGGGPSTAA